MTFQYNLFGKIPTFQSQIMPLQAFFRVYDSVEAHKSYAGCLSESPQYSRQKRRQPSAHLRLHRRRLSFNPANINHCEPVFNDLQFQMVYFSMSNSEK